MKKIFFITSIVSLSLASCKKDYTCVCTTALFPVSINTEAKSSKKGAEEWCKSYSTAVVTEDGQPTTNSLPLTCSIK